ncbi:MAG: PQQ-binding-like beta-propeller repeat protein, partial [Planctomycetota bacterium]
MARPRKTDSDESRSVSRREFLGQTLPAFGGIAAFAGVATSANASEQWTQFLGSNGTGVSTSPVQPPTRWSQDEGIRWRTEISGDGWSSPVVADGVV